MDFQSTQTVDRRTSIEPGTDELTEKRLAILLNANAETAQERSRFRTEQERFDAESMRRPLGPEKTFSYLGLMLGIFPPATIFARFAIEGDVLRDSAWFVGVLMIMNLVSAVVGFFSGKWIGKMVAGVEKMSWTKMILLLPLLGILWGFMSGGSGGFIFFVIGAAFGAVIGGMVGAIALTTFGILHRLLQRGNMIEVKHFVPLALGVTFSICSIILGQF